MRISDWSSDVCSSDLGQFHVAVVRTPLERARDTIAFTVIFIVAHVDAAGNILLPRTEHAVENRHAVELDALARGDRVRVGAVDQYAHLADTRLPAVRPDARNFGRRFLRDVAIGVLDRKGGSPPSIGRAHV